jgi:hypothetical protein
VGDGRRHGRDVAALAHAGAAAQVAVALLGRGRKRASSVSASSYTPRLNSTTTSSGTQ